MRSLRLLPVAIAFVLGSGCGSDSAASEDPTRLYIVTRLPGATASVDDSSTVLATPGGALQIESGIHGTGALLVLEGMAAREELWLDWASLYEAYRLPTDTRLEELTFQVRPDASGECETHITRALAAGTNLRDDGVPVVTGPCGAFGLQRFRVDETVPDCGAATPEVCSGFVEIYGDGTIRYDAVGGEAVDIREAILSEGDRSRARRIFAAPALLGFTYSCTAGDDLVVMTVETTLESGSIGDDCSRYEPYAEARALSDELVAAYFP